MASWKEDVSALRARLGGIHTIAKAVDEIAIVLGAHPEELHELCAAYRFASKEEAAVGVRVEDGAIRPLDEDEPADVTVSGSRDAMLGVLSGATNPLKAMLMGKLKVKGNMALLVKLAEKL